MRWSGLAIRDALTLKRTELEHDETKGLYRVLTDRQTTGVHVSVPIPPDIAEELPSVANGNPEYIFWSGNGDEESITKNWAKYYVKLFSRSAAAHRFSGAEPSSLAQAPLENGTGKSECQGVS